MPLSWLYPLSQPLQIGALLGRIERDPQPGANSLGGGAGAKERGSAPLVGVGARGGCAGVSHVPSEGERKVSSASKVICVPRAGAGQISIRVARKEISSGRKQYFPNVVNGPDPWCDFC